ncbi:MAG TPA: patatin-like phospholipase family protein [Thermoanaerobaculia bacterium]|nr:patatin-like phospholipase family protein [Thermoanaerobaculia bacterium]
MESAPLQLADVLEQESVRLHGAAGVPLPERWELGVEEILNARQLAYRLAERLVDAKVSHRRRPSRWGPRRVAYERERADGMKRLLDSWASNLGPRHPDKVKLAAEINRLLTASTWLRDQAGFEDLEHLPPFDSLPSVEDFSPSGKLDGSAPTPDEIVNLNRRMLDALFPNEVRPAAESRLGKAVDQIHERAKNGRLRTGLAISGGGIRSATFALGVLQGLARKHILERFDFVSTVSGGGYVGSWLSSWARRDRWGIRGVAALLAALPTSRLEPEPAPIRHLRAYSNYLTPRLGALSADTWALIATYLRNLLLTWLVLVPLLVALVAAPRLMVSAVTHHAGRTEFIVASAIGVGLLMAAFLLVVLARPVTDGKKRKRFTDGKFVRFCLVPFVLGALFLTLAWAWNRQYAATPSPWWRMPLWLSAMSLLGWAVFTFQLLTEPAPEGVVDDRQRTRRHYRIVWELVGSVVGGFVAGMLARLTATKLFPLPFDPKAAPLAIGAVRWPVETGGALSATTAAYVTLAPAIILGILFLHATLLIGIAGKVNHDFDREWWARASGWVLIAAVLWIALCAITIYGPIGIYYFPKLLTGVGGTAGLFAVLAGWSAKTKPKGPGGEESLVTKAVSAALGLAVPLFILFVLASVSLGTSRGLQRAMEGTSNETPGPSDAIVKRQRHVAGHAQRLRELSANERAALGAAADPRAKIRETLVDDRPRLRAQQHLHVLEHAGLRRVLVVLLAALAIAVLAARRIGVNVFSMHAMYRNRLVRAYLGASRWEREANLFTGFDPHDNLFMHELRPEYVWWHSFRDSDKALDLLRDAAPGTDGGTPTGIQKLYRELRDALGDGLQQALDAAMPGRIDPVLIQGLNTVIASADLIPPREGTVGHRRLRPLRNRRFIEQALGDALYPSPMPLLCAQDVRDSDRFVEHVLATPLADALRIQRDPPPTTGQVIDLLNDVIVKGSPALPAGPPTPDPTFDIGSEGHPVPLSPMIVNRLRIDAALRERDPNLINPLQPAKAIHLVDICLNLSSGDQLAWQQRKGEAFSVSPLAAGSPALGYRDSRWYGDISLGTAVTISGAAASPNMGYHSSPALAFLMTLFNVRLGWWLGNPGLAGQRTYRERNPVWSLPPLIREATGNTDDTYGYVYLSDGGHFENLGLYELVLRRCHRIFVSDAGADPKYAYDDLGNAVRKIRVDLGIPVRVTHTGIIPPSEKKPGKYCAVGFIDYPDVDGAGAVSGEFLYVKPVVYQEDVNLPRDVFNYARMSEEFPHEATADQWFDESQFESYRRLGSYAIEQICEAAEKPADVDSLEELIRAATRYLTPVIAPAP